MVLDAALALRLRPSVVEAAGRSQKILNNFKFNRLTSNYKRNVRAQNLKSFYLFFFNFLNTC